MNVLMYFIENHSYDFTNRETGERIQGIKCQCFDPESKQIVSVRTDKLLDLDFGDEIEIKCKPNGKYLNYVVE